MDEKNKVLKCPKCQAALAEEGEFYVCHTCGAKFRKKAPAAAPAAAPAPAPVVTPATNPKPTGKRRYKSFPMPATVLTVKEKDMYTMETAKMAVDPISKVIEEQAAEGWYLATIENVHAAIYRKKGFFEIIFGWIPIIGSFFKSSAPDVIEPTYQTLIFYKDE